MHKFSMPEEIIARVVARVGRTHPFDKLEFHIVPAIYKFAVDLRDRGAHVIWVSVFHEWLMSGRRG